MQTTESKPQETKPLKKSRKYLKDNGLLAAPFDKGVGFSVMRKQTFESKLESLYGLAKIHKAETPLRPVLSLPDSSYENLNKMLAKLSCTSTYVGQTVRHLTTRIEEHKKADSPVSLHLEQGQLEGNSADLS